MVEVNKISQKEYGNLMKFKGVFGRRDIVMTFDPDDVAKVFRTEGLWPTRRGSDVFTYYRHHVNKKIFKDGGGLLGE
jgi:cytochrome P450 family 12